MSSPILVIRNFTVSSKQGNLITEVNLQVKGGGVLGLLGPSGAGKSTLLKSINRLIELSPGLTLTGDIEYRGRSVFDKSTNVNDLRCRIGMLFQQPVIFPTTILNNVIFGARRTCGYSKVELASAAEHSLREVALWHEVKDRLRTSASLLSIGQQQRLCLARALVCEPDVILMDEPTSSLDPKSAASVEDLILNLGLNHTVVIVTHQLHQATRVCDKVALMNGGAMIACGQTAEVIESQVLRSVFSMSNS